MSKSKSRRPYIQPTPQMTPGQLTLLDQLTDLLGGQLGEGVEAYPGQMAPGVSPLQESTFGLISDLLGGRGPYGGAMTRGAETVESLMRPFDPGAAREYWEETYKAPMMETWGKEVIPGIMEKYAGMGALDSSGIGRALGESGRRLTTELGGTLADVLFRAEQAHEGRRLGAVPLATSLPESLTRMGLGAGGMERGIEAELLQEPFMKWQTEQPWASPWLRQISTALGAKPIEIVAAPRQESFGLCVLATACYGKDSDEVRFFRCFRDHGLPRKILRGYYVFSDVVVPLIKHKPTKRLVRLMIVNPLTRAGRRLLFNRSHTFGTIFDCMVALGWLTFWKILGSRGPYRRESGEMV